MLARAARNLIIIISKADPEIGPEYSELPYLCGNLWCLPYLPAANVLAELDKTIDSQELSQVADQQQQHLLRLQQHAMLVSDGLCEKATTLLEARALPGLSAVAAKSASELAQARVHSDPTSPRCMQAYISALETIVFAVKMAAEGTASSIIKLCPQLDHTLRHLKVLPGSEEAKGSAKDNDAIRNTSWVIPVEVCSGRSPPAMHITCATTLT